MEELDDIGGGGVRRLRIVQQFTCGESCSIIFNHWRLVKENRKEPPLENIHRGGHLHFLSESLNEKS